MSTAAADRLRELRVEAALTEFSAVRAQILDSVRRSHNLAIYGVGGAAAILTAIAGFRFDTASTLVAQLLVVAGLAILALAYVGNFGEMLQAGDYLMDLGAWVRSMLGVTERPPDDSIPLLRFEEKMADRTRSGPWSVLASTLAAFEMGGTVTAAVGLLIWAASTYFNDASTQSLLASGLLVLDLALAVTLLSSIGVLVSAQHHRLIKRKADKAKPPR